MKEETKVTPAKGKTMTYDDLLDKLRNDVKAIIEPQDRLIGELNELKAVLQQKTNEVKELTLKDPGADIESIFDEIQKLEKQKQIILLKLKTWPEEPSKDFRSVLQRAQLRKDGKDIIKLAENTLFFGIKEMDEIQARVDELVKKTIPELEDQIVAIATEVGEAERRKVKMAAQLLDIDACFPREKRKRPMPKPCVSWPDVCIDDDRAGKAFGREIPVFKWLPGTNI